MRPVPARALALALSSMLFIGGSSGLCAQDEVTPDETERTIALESDSQSDAAIAARVRDIFAEFEAFDDISIDVNAGVVVLGGTALDTETADEAERLANRVEGVVTVRSEIAQKTSVEETLGPAFDRLGTRLEHAVDRLPLFGVAVVVFLIFLVIGLWITRPAMPWHRVAPNAFIADLVRQVVKLGFIVVGLVVALDILGAAALLGTMLGAAGIVGLAVGFAVRDTIENYIASIMLSLRQPFRPNDLVKIDDHEGHVIRLTSRATVLMTLEGNHLRIPNAYVFKGVILNYSRSPERRFEFRLGVDADSNVMRAMAIGVETMEALGFVLADPEPLGLIEDVGDSNVVLWFAGWIDQRESDHAKARSEAIRLTKRALEEAGFALPEPIYRLRFDDKMPTGVSAPAPTLAAEPTNGTNESPDVGDAQKDASVDEKIAAERANVNQEDLLDPNAPSE